METLWDRTKHAFEKILQDGEKAAERMIESFEELGDTAKARLEKARLERALFKRSAELGHTVYELHVASTQPREGAPGESKVATLEDPKIKELLNQMARLDGDLEKIEQQLNKRGGGTAGAIGS